MMRGTGPRLWLPWVGVGYVLLVLAAALNVVLAAWGAPHLQSLLVAEGRCPGRRA